MELIQIFANSIPFSYLALDTKSILHKSFKR